MNLDNIIGIVTDLLVYRGSSFARPKFGTQDEVWFQFQFPEFKISNSGNVSYNFLPLFWVQRIHETWYWASKEADMNET